METAIGKDKLVVTPGLVELGRLEKEENFNFGVKMAKVATSIIIVNKVNLESKITPIKIPHIKERIKENSFFFVNLCYYYDNQKIFFSKIF